jgi:hypothetical protein
MIEAIALVHHLASLRSRRTIEALLAQEARQLKGS